MNATVQAPNPSVRRPGKNKYVYGALLLVFVLSLVLRIYGYRQPHGGTFDEGLYAELLAGQLLEDPAHYSSQEAYQRLMAAGQWPPLPVYLDRPLFKHPPLFCYLIAANYAVFGVSDAVAVSVSVVFGSLMVLVIFFLGKILYDERVGLLSALFLCIDPIHWVCSEKIWMETTLCFFVLLSVLLFLLGQKREWYYWLAGVSAGMALLTKYTGVLPLLILGSFAAFFERPLLKNKSFWGMFGLAFVVFLPWIIWNWRVYGNLTDPFFGAHNLGGHAQKAQNALAMMPVGGLVGLLVLAGTAFVFRREITSFFQEGAPGNRGNRPAAVYLAVLILALAALPFFREMVRESFAWNNSVFVGWRNLFHSEPRTFYLTRLTELSPVYLLSFLSFPFLFGKNRGDRLLVWASLVILVAFILFGNYQSRYILPAVPFLLVLSARWLVRAYDAIAGFRTLRGVVTALLLFVVLYFIVQTLKVGSLIALGPDFGYF